MFSTKTTGSVIAEILMESTSFKGAFILVEGDHDFHFWKTRATPLQSKTILSGNKLTVLRCLDDPSIRKINGIVGIVDHDYEKLERTFTNNDNIHPYDTHDLEAMLLRSEALDKILAEHCDANLTNSFETSNRKSVRDALIERALVFGKLRWLSIRKSWEIPFSNSGRPPRFIDQATWSLNKEGLFNWFLSHAPITSYNEIDAELSALPVGDPWDVIHGHDAVDILAIGLRGVLCGKQIGTDTLLRELRLSFEDNHFINTDVLPAN